MPHRLPHLGRGPIAHRRAEVDEVLAPSILRPSRTKGVSKKVKFLIRIPTTPVIILAVDDFRLVRMQLQLATFQPCLNAALDGLRLLLAYAVRDEVSRPGESHPQALSEPYMNVSAHTAPIIQPSA